MVCGPESDCRQSSGIPRRAEARVKVQKSPRGGVQTEGPQPGLIQGAITDH